MTPTAIRDNLKALSSYLLESSGPDFMFETVEQAIVLLGEGSIDWVLVPRRPTQAMILAAQEHNVDFGADMGAAYRAMLAAAPSPPK